MKPTTSDHSNTYYKDKEYTNEIKYDFIRNRFYKINTNASLPYGTKVCT